MRILIDLDNVTAAWCQAVLTAWNEDNGTNYTTKDVKTLDLEETLGRSSTYHLSSILKSSYFYETVDPVPGAIDGIKSLIVAGHDVCIVSAIPNSEPNLYFDKVRWIRTHLPFFNMDNFIATNRKDAVAGDVLVDDSPGNLEAFSNTGRWAIAFDYRWNRTWDGVRVRDWKELLQEIALLDLILDNERLTLSKHTR